MNNVLVAMLICPFLCQTRGFLTTKHDYFAVLPTLIVLQLMCSQVTVQIGESASRIYMKLAFLRPPLDLKLR